MLSKPDGSHGQGAGISANSVHRVWDAHALESHRVRQFRLSTDPQFADDSAIFTGRT